MTVKEAILTLNANAVIACERAGFSSATVKMIEYALDTIEDALKAQEPMEPIENAGFYYCGACRYAFTSARQKYCSECGRAVKWE